MTEEEKEAEAKKKERREKSRYHLTDEAWAAWKQVQTEGSATNWFVVSKDRACAVVVVALWWIDGLGPFPLA